MMKKIIALLVAVVLLCLTACGQEQPNDVPQITIGAQQSNDKETAGNDATEASDAADSGKAFAFTFNGVTLLPGAAFDPSKLPEASFTYEVPSCALDGTDNVYNYESFEVTAFDEGKGEFIYSIYFIDPNLTTPEGLALGDTLKKAIDLYGSDYTKEDGACIFESAGTQLVLILQEESIISIEYRLVTE